jgi:hypothetical protein
MGVRTKETRINKLCDHPQRLSIVRRGKKNARKKGKGKENVGDSLRWFKLTLP